MLDENHPPHLYVVFVNILLNVNSVLQGISVFTISSRTYFRVFFALGPIVFIRMDLPQFYLAFLQPRLDEWKETPLGNQSTNETENHTYRGRNG